MTTTIMNWISGSQVEATSGQQLPIYNPATGAVTGQVQLASHADVDSAVASAKAAFLPGATCRPCAVLAF